MLSYSFGPHLQRPPLGASSPGVCELQKSNLLVWRLVLNSLTFFKSPQTSSRFRCVTSLAPRHPFRLGLLWHLNDTSIRPCAPALTPASMLHLTHVLSRKVLSLTKLKGVDRNPLAITLHLSFSKCASISLSIYIYTYIYHHHLHVTLSARIFLTLSHHPSL